MNKLSHLILRVANASLDPVIRTKILEGAAGVHPDMWARLPNGLQAAEKWFFANNIPMDAEWFVRRGTKFYNALYQGAMKVLHNPQEAEDLVMNVIAGITRSQSVKGGQLYEVGMNLAKAGDISPTKARGWLARHTMQRAISNMRRNNRQESLSVTNEDGDMSVRDLPNNIDDNKTMESILDFLRSPAGGDVFRKIRTVLANLWSGAPSKLEVFDMMVANPTMSDVAIARILRPVADDTEGSWVNRGAATYVSKIRRQVKTLIPDIIAKNPSIMRDVDLQTELAQLGYGQARMARRAANLAILLHRT